MPSVTTSRADRVHRDGPGRAGLVGLALLLVDDIFAPARIEQLL